MSTNSKENSIMETIFETNVNDNLENNTTTSKNNVDVDIATFFNDVAESLKSLPSVSSDTESVITSAELQEIENFIENFGNKSSFSRNDSKENLK